MSMSACIPRSPSSTGTRSFLPNWAQSYVDQVDGIRGTISPLEALRLLEQVLA